jgi:hypothetical protein
MNKRKKTGLESLYARKYIGESRIQWFDSS